MSESAQLTLMLVVEGKLLVFVVVQRGRFLVLKAIGSGLLAKAT